MMRITRQINQGKTVLTFDGIADESFNPVPEFNGLTGEVFVVAAKVSRINSTAAKRWITCFEGLKAAGLKVRFVAISPALVEQFNLISNFGGGHKVLSAVLPFMCKSCNGPNYVVQTKEEALVLDLEKVDWPCMHCKQPTLEFDDLPQEYLAFWKRQKPIQAP